MESIRLNPTSRLSCIYQTVVHRFTELFIGQTKVLTKSGCIVKYDLSLTIYVYMLICIMKCFVRVF
jgi:hypothetical protein